MLPRAWAVDIRIQAGIGRFFAAKFRSALAYPSQAANGGSFGNIGRREMPGPKLANIAKGVYRPDVSFGYEYQLRGHWLDRLQAIDEDIARMEKLPKGGIAVDRRTPRFALHGIAVTRLPRAFSRARRSTWRCRWKPPKAAAVILHYRHVNQVERFATLEMTASKKRVPRPHTGRVHEVSVPDAVLLRAARERTSSRCTPGLGPR